MIKKENFILKQALSEILRGFSVFNHESKVVYIKHLTFLDCVDYEIIYEKYFDTLLRKGVELEKDILERHIKNGLWSEADDLKLKSLEEDIEVQQKTVEKTIVKEQKIEVQKYLDELKAKYNLLSNKKFSLVQNSCEFMTNKKMNEYYVVQSLFKDSSLQERFISDDEMDDDEFDFYPFIKGYGERIKNLNVGNIKKICISAFFRNLWEVSDDNHAYFFFGKPTSLLTNYQNILADYAKLFGNIFKNYPQIKSDDPDKIIQLAQQRSEIERRGGKPGNTNYTNMTSSEYEEMGIKRPGKESLFEKALENGGKFRVK